MPNLTQQQLFFLYLTGTANAAGVVTLHSKGLKPGGVLTFDIVSTMCADKAGVIAEISFHLGGQDMYLKTLANTTEDYWYKTRGPVRIPSDWCVQVGFSGADVGDVCHACCYGYVEYPE